MIYVKLEGRLGNILFQIAAGCSLAKRLHVPFKAIITDYQTPDGHSLAGYLALFRENMLRNVELLTEMPPHGEVYHEPGFTFQPLPEKDNLILKGYFQSEKYFDEPTIRELFRVDPETDTYIHTRYGPLLDKHPVCIHVRRGDYLHLEAFHTVCTSAYYRRSMQYFPETSYFLIASDDIAWCKTQFRGERFFFVEDETPVATLYLLGMCSHYILSNSSFSWWGAWLNPDPTKTVICPTPWFGYRLRHNKTIDLFPASWIRIPVYSYPLGVQIHDCRIRLQDFLSRFYLWVYRILKQQRKNG